MSAWRRRFLQLGPFLGLLAVVAFFAVASGAPERYLSANNLPEDASDSGFLIANAGQEYWVNDASQAGDLFTTAVGDNLQAGKSPTAPMASLGALLMAYDLDPGDVLHVDTGTYRLVRNLVLSAEDSGVRIEGPAAATALLDRGNTSSGSYVFEPLGGDDVTLDHLWITGARTGVYAAAGSGSDRLTISHCTIYGMPGNGIYLAEADGVATGNTVYSTSTGIDVRGARTQVLANEVYNNSSYGIYAYYSGSASSDRIVASGNQVHHNTTTGIYAYSNVLVTGNTVWGSGGTGIQLDGAAATANVVFDNATGIAGGSYYSEVIENNRVYHNTGTGIAAYNTSQVRGNVVYSNSVGIEGVVYNSFMGTIANNLVYANSNQGIRVTGGRSGAQVVNNTVYQPVGNAVLIEGSSQSVSLRNNILWVDAGYDINVAPDSQVGFASDYNLLYQGSDPNAHVGSWNSAIRDTLADWRSATGQDAHSVDGNPNFVDMDGADNVLGYTTAGSGYNGGLDDNFYTARLSPAIDCGDAWSAPLADLRGLGRYDDPGVPNGGSLEYAHAVLGANQFAATGTAQGWRSNSTYWTLTFPSGFTFPFYGTLYSSVTVSTEGFLYFSGPMWAGDGGNTTDKLQSNRIIAPLWDNLRTNGSGDNIYVDTSVLGQVTIRWDATNETDGSDVNFAVVLSSAGTIRFDYGTGNANLTPTIGISRGDGQFYLLSSYDGRNDLANVNSAQFALTPGLTYVDLGCYEFRASSSDTTPPQVTATIPSIIDAAGRTIDYVSRITVSFSEELNSIDAGAPANYELRQAGADGTLDTADDTLYTLSPLYTFNPDGGTSVTVFDLGLGSDGLPVGLYRLTVHGGAASAIHDTAGNRLDGNADGAEGPDYVRTFVIFRNHAPDLDNSGNMTLAVIDEEQTTNGGTLISAIIASAGGDRITDLDADAGEGIAVTAVVNTNGAWQYKIGAGVWTDFGTPSAAAARLLASDSATWIRFVPSADWNGTVLDGITFRAWDQTSGTAGDTADTTTNGGTAAFSAATETASITVSQVNDAPAGTDAARTMAEGGTYTFAASDFGFSDPLDIPANAFLAVKITTLATAGSVNLNGTPVTAGQMVSVTDVTAGQLTFVPVANASGSPYATFTFQVQDDGGTAGDGVDLDPSPNTMTVNVQSSCNLDVDGNGRADALTDGILILRYLFDPAGQWNYSDALGSGATRTTRPAIKTYLDGGAAGVLDVDGNGRADALTDGILILRYLFDPAGQWNYSDALGAGATRTSRAAIKAYLDQYNPSLAPAPGLTAVGITEELAEVTPTIGGSPLQIVPVPSTTAVGVAGCAVVLVPAQVHGTIQNSPIVVGTSTDDQLIAGVAPTALLGGYSEDFLFGRTITHEEAADPANTLAQDTVIREWNSPYRYDVPITRLPASSNSSTLTEDSEALDRLYGEDGLEWSLTKNGGSVLAPKVGEVLTTL